MASEVLNTSSLFYRLSIRLLRFYFLNWGELYNPFFFPVFRNGHWIRRSSSSVRKAIQNKRCKLRALDLGNLKCNHTKYILTAVFLFCPVENVCFSIPLLPRFSCICILWWLKSYSHKKVNSWFFLSR